jgi:hypothetical protein
MIVQPVLVLCPSRRWTWLRGWFRRLTCEHEQGHLGRHRATVRILRYEYGEEREWVEWA